MTIIKHNSLGNNTKTTWCTGTLHNRTRTRTKKIPESKHSIGTVLVPVHQEHRTGTTPKKENLIQQKKGFE